METSKEEQRWNFVDAVPRGQWSVSELCARFGISRTTGYKGLTRGGAAPSTASDNNRSRAPATCPHRTPVDIEHARLALRARYEWGAQKLLHILARRHRGTPLPARSTGNAILDRHGKLRKSRRRPRWQHPGAGPVQTHQPNQVWPADFKGSSNCRMGSTATCRSSPSPVRARSGSNSTTRFSATPCATNASASKRSATASGTSSTTPRSSRRSTNAPEKSPATYWKPCIRTFVRDVRDRARSVKCLSLIHI